MTRLPVPNSNSVSTPDGRRVFVREHFHNRVLLGISFGEMGVERPVSGLIRVRAHALGTDGRMLHSTSSVDAMPTHEGIYAFHRLPGLSVTSAPTLSGVDPPDREYVFEVRDLEGRFLPVALRVASPWKRPDLFWLGSSNHAGLEEDPAPPVRPRFYLFSSPARTVPSMLAAVRAQLWDAEINKPAAHAVLEVQHGPHRWYGLADERGSSLVVFGYPPLTPDLENLESGDDRDGLMNEAWELEVRVRYQRDKYKRFDALGLVELGAAFDQGHAGIVAGQGEGTLDRWIGSLQYGRELVLRTKGESTLWLT